MSLPLDFDHDERIQKTLQELCVAEFAQFLCEECASGKGCCAGDLANDQRTHSPRHSELEETKEATMEQQEMGEIEEYDKKGRVRRQKLTIDLSNDENLTDGEILRRLLSPLGSPLSDEPLEVILEIVDEEDEEDDDHNYEPMPTQKTFRSLREKLREVTGGFPSREDHKTRFRRDHRRGKCDYQYSANNASSRSTRKSYSSVKTCPSFQKANSLINEIERCFIETASLVEKTLETSNFPQNSELKLEGITPQTTKPETSEQVTQTIEEALHIFDTILSESQNRAQEKHIEYRDERKPKIDFYKENNFQRYSPSPDFVQNRVDTSNESCWYSQTPHRVMSDVTVNKLNKKHWTQGFERDIDELFRECYALSSIEPSTSLGSCLKNLESLCFQLKRAKENILLEMKEEYNKKMELCEDSFDSNASQTSSLDSQECLSFINELIEKKLKDKFKQKKFSLDPPLMGLEGRTHKIIAEVLPLKLISENGRYIDNENGYYQNAYRTNYSKTQDSAYSSNNTVNISSGENDIYSESSGMSTATNTLESNRCVSSSSREVSDRSEEPYKYSFSETSEEEQNAYMSYEETLALYEDNQELQRSLLSILHSLNDIHDNFLSRRRMEIAMSQKSSSFIQNNLKAEISSSIQHACDFHHTDSFPENSFDNPNSYTKELSYADKRNLSSKFNGDSDSIEKIIRVSDELKHLWLHGTDDLHLRNRRPSRSVSFNRGVNRYRRLLKRREDPSSDEFDYSSIINEKSISMPNLSNLPHHESYVFSPDGSSARAQFPTSLESPCFARQNQGSFFEDNFSHPKSENAESYDMTMNFIQRLMDACGTADKKGEERCDFLQPDSLHPYNAYLRTCS